MKNLLLIFVLATFLLACNKSKNDKFLEGPLTIENILLDSGPGIEANPNK